MIRSILERRAGRAGQPLWAAVRHRHLLGGFVSREVKGRFAGSLAGIAWTLINPLVNILIYIMIFSLVMRIAVSVEETGTDSFVVFFLSGMFPWMMFAEGIGRSVGILVENGNLITKVVFPVELLPAGAVVSASLVNGVGMALFLVYLTARGFFHPTWFLLFIVIPLQLLFTWGLANLLSALCVFVRDTREMLGIVLLVWFYGTPIIYPASMVPEAARPLLACNPMGIFITLYRELLLVHRVPWELLAFAGIFSMASYAGGSWFFMRAKGAFGDVL